MWTTGAMMIYLYYIADNVSDLIAVLESLGRMVALCDVFFFHFLFWLVIGLIVCVRSLLSLLSVSRCVEFGNLRVLWMYINFLLTNRDRWSCIVRFLSLSRRSRWACCRLDPVLDCGTISPFCSCTTLFDCSTDWKHFSTQGAVGPAIPDIGLGS